MPVYMEMHLTFEQVLEKRIAALRSKVVILESAKPEPLNWPALDPHSPNPIRPPGVRAAGILRKELK